MRPEGDPPVCDCHGVAMCWNRDPRCRAGGYWRCAEQKREWRRARWATDPEWAERHRERQRAKRATDPEWSERERERRRARWATDPEWAEQNRERGRERRRNLIAQGLCRSCARPAIDTECEHCKSKKALRSLTRVRIYT